MGELRSAIRHITWLHRLVLLAGAIGCVVLIGLINGAVYAAFGTGDFWTSFRKSTPRIAIALFVPALVVAVRARLRR